MIGLVLWYKPDPGVGMVWCEDQGPLAFLGPEASLPPGAAALLCGDQLVFSFELREGVRYVRDVFSVAHGTGGRDPAEILTDFHASQRAEPRIRGVA